jgi:hypothetical protein
MTMSYGRLSPAAHREIRLKTEVLRLRLSAACWQSLAPRLIYAQLWQSMLATIGGAMLESR